MDKKLKNSLKQKLSKTAFPIESNIEQIIFYKKNKRKKYFAVFTPVIATVALVILLFGNLFLTNEPVYTEDPNHTVSTNNMDAVQWENKVYINSGEVINSNKVGRKIGNILSNKDIEHLGNSEATVLEKGTPIYILKDNSGIAIMVKDKWILYKK